VAKLMKYAIVIVLFLMVSLGIAYASNTSFSIDDDIDVPENFAFINQMLLESSRYTQTDEVPTEVQDLYESTYTLSYSEDDIQTLGFVQMFDTPELTVYFEKDSFSLMIKNKETGYFWSSRPEFQGMSGSREDNVANRNLMNSGLWISSVTANNITSANVTTQSLYSLAQVNYLNDASITEANSDHLRPYQTEPGSYSKRRVETTIETQSAQHFVVHVDLKIWDISFNVEIHLIEGGIEVYIPIDSIEESGEIYKLTAINVFPYFGASREDKMPGYLVIPDGIGALVRTNQRYNTYFQARFFGSDMGYQTSILPELSLPIYGNIHNPGQDGFYASISEGAEFTTLIANFWGSNTRYHRINARFNVRTIYRNIINKAGEGNDRIPVEFVPSDYRIAFKVLGGEDASYVGMAKDYRDQLIDQGVLTAREKVTNDQIPIQLSYIMSDQEPAFIGTVKVVMTTANQVKDAYDFFKSEGLENQQVTLMGWSVDGFVNRAPYRTRTFDRHLGDLVEHITEDGNYVFLENDYTRSSEDSRRATYNRDVARNLSRLKMVFRRRTLNTQVQEIYFLYPESSLRFAKDDLSFYENLGVSGVHLNSLGNNLMSYYDGDIRYRNETIAQYQEIAGLYEHLSLSRPNQYLYAYIDSYMDLAITNSQYDYYTDLVPLIPIILKGSVSYYTPYLNFNALSDDRLLTMVDFAVNPSYVLTEELTYAMRYTPSSIFYTTTLSDYEQEILDTYHFVNNALRHVIHAQIENRVVLRTGLVEITYDNGVTIFVNYNYTRQTVGTLQVAARSYEVVLP